MTPADSPRPPALVGVLGGGRMGAGIAHAFLLAGSDVAVVERDAEAAASARSRVHASIERSRAEGGTDVPPGTVADALHVGTDVVAFAGRTLVVEALPEDRVLKLDGLRRVENLIAGDGVLATNTSSISINTLGSGLQHPERFLGLHFFNPVPASQLVEVVIGTSTDDGLAARAQEWVASLGKQAITVRDSPGFASSRLGVALGLEAIRMLEDGVATAADIDRAMELGYRHPMGPLRTTDIVGLDVRLGIAQELEAAFGERFAAPALLRQMVAEGRLGRKSGSGFYEWSGE